MLEIKELCFSYSKTIVLKDINASVRKGEVAVLLGPNGSGKSTLLRCMAGLLKPSSGQVLLEGKKLKEYGRKQLAKKLCFLPQTHEEAEELYVWELVCLGRSPYSVLGWQMSEDDKAAVEKAMDYMNIGSYQHRKLSQLSGGERQRVWIAMILAQDADIILLDEPVAFLDIKYQWELLKLVASIARDLRKTFIVVLHDINHALAIADRFLVMKQGCIYRMGNHHDIITSDMIHEVYGINTHVHQLAGCKRPVIIPKTN